MLCIGGQVHAFGRPLEGPEGATRGAWVANIQRRSREGAALKPKVRAGGAPEMRIIQALRRAFLRAIAEERLRLDNQTERAPERRTSPTRRQRPDCGVERMGRRQRTRTVSQPRTQRIRRPKSRTRLAHVAPRGWPGKPKQAPWRPIGGQKWALWGPARKLPRAAVWLPLRRSFGAPVLPLCRVRGGRPAPAPGAAERAPRWRLRSKPGGRRGAFTASRARHNTSASSAARRSITAPLPCPALHGPDRVGATLEC